MNNTRLSLAPLHWHEDLDAALGEARRRAVPVLSLRLLGRLDEELSCANSRFFRTTLYPDPRVAAVLARDFVLHWRSVRPVPVVTIDFGDGRTLTRTLTGNSAHLVLDVHGRPVDALPGLYAPRGFLDALAWARALAVRAGALHGHERTRMLARAHAAPPKYVARVAPLHPGVQARVAAQRGARDARQAGVLAATKMMVEAPLLDRIDDLATTIVRDEAFNETVLHPQLRARFVRGLAGEDEGAFTEWLYDEVFLMPADDPWLGLVQGFAALEDDGRSVA